jgi:hypothetical protein
MAFPGYADNSVAIRKAPGSGAYNDLIRPEYNKKRIITNPAFTGNLVTRRLDFSDRPFQSEKTLRSLRLGGSDLSFLVGCLAKVLFYSSCDVSLNSYDVNLMAS